MRICLSVLSLLVCAWFVDDTWIVDSDADDDDNDHSFL